VTLRERIESFLEELRRGPSPAPTPPPAPVPPQPAPSPRDVAVSLLGAHNALRTARGRPPLAYSAPLVAAAEAHARWMASRGEMSHQGRGEPSPWERITSTGYRYSRAAENVAAGQRDVAAVMAAWRNSPGHLANILGPCTEMGAAMAVGANGTPYWSVSFASPLSAGFAIDGRMMITTTISGPDRNISGIRHALEGERWEDAP
jgi:uncharacterized protein YkwD